MSRSLHAPALTRRRSLSSEQITEMIKGNEHDTATSNQERLVSRQRSAAAAAASVATCRAKAARRAETGVIERANPATSETHYTDNQNEFLMAVDAFKHRTGRKFPTLIEILEIAEALGWSRRDGSWPNDPKVRTKSSSPAA